MTDQSPTPDDEQRSGPARSGRTRREPVSRRYLLGAAFGGSLIWAPSALAKAHTAEAPDLDISLPQLQRIIRSEVHAELSHLGLLKGNHRGATGRRGATGTSGATGAQGSAGQGGAAGAQGSAGQQGATGLMGSGGSTGAAGAAGPTGAAGATGDGPTGAFGPTGAAGPTGVAGPTGAGPTGPNVSSGPQDRPVSSALPVHRHAWRHRSRLDRTDGHRVVLRGLRQSPQRFPFAPRRPRTAVR